MLGVSRDLTARELAGLNSGRRLRTPEAAEYLGIATNTLEKMRCAGTGPEFEYVGPRAVVYRIEALETYLAARRATSTSQRPVAPPPRHTVRPSRQQRGSRRGSH
jgi:predicted DNA-binding transcriptional regulator AlpA